MTITQTVEIPPDRRITLEVPPHIPAGEVIIAFTPVVKDSQAETGNKIRFTRKELDEMVKNSPTLHKITGILHTDMTIDEIRTARLAKHL